VEESSRSLVPFFLNGLSGRWGGSSQEDFLFYFELDEGQLKGPRKSAGNPETPRKPPHLVFQHPRARRVEAWQSALCLSSLGEESRLTRDTLRRNGNTAYMQTRERTRGVLLNSEKERCTGYAPLRLGLQQGVDGTKCPGTGGNRGNLGGGRAYGSKRKWSLKGGGRQLVLQSMNESRTEFQHRKNYLHVASRIGFFSAKRGKRAHSNKIKLELPLEKRLDLGGGSSD